MLRSPVDGGEHPADRRVVRQEEQRVLDAQDVAGVGVDHTAVAHHRHALPRMGVDRCAPPPRPPPPRSAPGAPAPGSSAGRRRPSAPRSGCSWRRPCRTRPARRRIRDLEAEAAATGVAVSRARRIGLLQMASTPSSSSHVSEGRGLGAGRGERAGSAGPSQRPRRCGLGQGVADEEQLHGRRFYAAAVVNRLFVSRARPGGDVPSVVLVHGSLDRSAAFLRTSATSTTSASCATTAGATGSRSRSARAGSFDQQVDDLAAASLGRRRCSSATASVGWSRSAFAQRHPDRRAAVVAYEAPMAWESWWPSNRRVGRHGWPGDPAEAAERFMRA